MEVVNETYFRQHILPKRRVEGVVNIRRYVTFGRFYLPNWQRDN